MLINTAFPFYFTLASKSKIKAKNNAVIEFLKFGIEISRKL